MKKLMLIATCGLCVAGCSTFGERATLPPNIENVPVVLAPNRDLKSAVVVAAARRRWTPAEVDAETIRCTLVQRAHKVVVDVRLIDERHYSVLMVESNIPAKKVAQWVNNLQREIAKYAVR